MSPYFETMYSNSGLGDSNMKAVGSSGDYGGSSGDYREGSKQVDRIKN